jgi:hypothetical protein
MREREWKRRLAVVIGAGLTIALRAALVHAQGIHIIQGTVTGLVHDDAGKPIAGVEVSPLERVAPVRTDTAGRFIIDSVDSGTLSLRFRRLAFEPVVLNVQVPPADTTDVDVTLSVVAHRLTGVVVQADARQLRSLADFNVRRQRGVGHFITRYEIEQRHPMLLSDMMRMVPGAILTPGTGGRAVLHFARNGRAHCPPQYFVDGIQVTGYNIDDMPPGDVEGIELYPGTTGVPPQYNRPFGDTECGTVLIWTRIPGA